MDKCRKAREIRKEVEETSKQLQEIESALGNTGQRCSNCHNRNHTVRSCKMGQCESAFFCGELNKHPEEKLHLQDKKKEIAALYIVICC